MNRTARVATTAGAFVAAGAVATLLNGRQRTRRRLRRGEDVEFGSVHSTPLTVTADDGVAINVEVDEAPDAPPGSPTVVFVHGWVCTLDSWHYQRLALRGRVRMVLMDHRSHGGSGRAEPDAVSLAHLAADLRAVVDAVAPEGPLVLVGHSMGGMTIMQLAGDDPSLFQGRVKGVALVSTSSGRLMRSSPGLRRLVPFLRVASPLLDWGRAFNSYSVIRRWGLGPNAQERHVDMTNEMLLRAPTHVLMDFYPNFLELDLVPALKGLGAAETVVVCGTKDLLTPFKHSRRLVDAIPGARLVGVNDAGHMVMFEDHQTVTGVVEELVEAAR